MTRLKRSGVCRRKKSRRCRRIVFLLILNMILVLLTVPFLLTKDKAPEIISNDVSYEIESGI